jgi:hypothetical protein
MATATVHPRLSMATKLEKALKREVIIDGRPHTVTISPDGIKVVEKGKRKGHELTWSAIVSGEAQLADDLRISLDATAP